MAQQAQQAKACIVVMGVSGVGKSSLINAFCGAGSAVVSSGSDSQTKDCSTFTDRQGCMWMDTQGTQDSAREEKDEDVLAKVVEKMAAEGVHEVKIVWVMLPANRSLSCLQTVAQAIGALGAGAWRATVVVVSRGDLELDADQVDGVLAAAAANGADQAGLRERAFGYKCMDWMDEARHPKLPRFRRMEVEVRKLSGFLTEEEVKAELAARLAAVPSFPVLFHKDECARCACQGVATAGGKQLSKGKCHGKPERHHPGARVSEHPGLEEPYHPQPAAMAHTKKLARRHNGDAITRHGAGVLQRYHPEPPTTRRHEVGARVTKAHVGGITRIHRGYLKTEHHTSGGSSSSYHHGELQTRNLGGRWVAGIFTAGLTQLADWEKEWSCCGGKRDSTGCKARTTAGRTTTTSHYTGCGCSGGQGCTKVYSCCDGRVDEKAPPCTPAWPCCGDTNTSSPGCLRVHGCCQEEPSIGASAGCRQRHAGCGHDEGTPGCRELCDECQAEWGSVGCEEYYPCCEQPSTADGCAPVHLCCGETEGATAGCQRRMSCCERGPKEPECRELWACCPEAEEGLAAEGCEARCSQCQVAMGEGPGCLPVEDGPVAGEPEEDAVRHEWRPCAAPGEGQ